MNNSANVPFPVELQMGAFELFNHLPDVCLFAKDLELRFILCNPALLRMLGCNKNEDVLGKRDADFFPAHLCEMFQTYDRHLIETGEPVIDRAELIRNPNGTIDWFLTTKLPLRDASGSIIGLVGYTRNLKHFADTHNSFLSMNPVMEKIMTCYSENLSIVELAGLMAMTPGHFARVFKRRFKMTPSQYILKVRVSVACELLLNTKHLLSTIALETGFFDQSHFYRNFKYIKGISPSDYRRKYSSALHSVENGFDVQEDKN